MSPVQGVATNWPELIEGGTSDENLFYLERLRKNLAKGVPNRVVALASDDSSVAAVGILRGSASLRGAVAGLEPAIERSVASAATSKPLPTSALEYLSVLMTLECAGFLAKPYGGADPHPLLDVLTKDMANRLSDPERHSVAIAAISLGRNEVVAEALGGGPLSAAIEPGQTFGFDVPSFVRYLAVSVATGASAAAVAPAWGAFVSAFPRKLAASTLRWHDLVWAGRSYYHLIEKRPVSEVVDAISGLVHAA